MKGIEPLVGVLALQLVAWMVVSSALLVLMAKNIGEAIVDGILDLLFWA